MKEILKNLNLKTSGNKADLIERILQNQITYLNLLPKDISNLVSEYQTYNNKTNQFLLLILNCMRYAHLAFTDKNPNIVEFSYLLLFQDMYVNGKGVEILNKLFEDFNLPVRFIATNNKFKGDIEIGKLPLISDKFMAKFLILLLQLSIIRSNDALNQLLWEEKMPFIITQFNNHINSLPVVIYRVMYNGEIEENIRKFL